MEKKRSYSTQYALRRPKKSKIIRHIKQYNILYFYQDYSVKEMAALYNCSESTVRSRLNYAKKFMKNEIEKLESKETKHRCIILLPFLYALFANQRKAFACEIPNSLNVVSQVMIGGTSNATAGNMLTTVTNTGKAVAVKMSIGKIVAICALALTLVAGGIGALIYFTGDKQNEETTTKNNNGGVVDKEESKDKNENNLNEKVDKNKGQIEKLGYWGLLLFVGVPLPGTGAWTGTLLAAVLNMDKKKSFFTIMAGVFMASIIMMILSYGLVANLVR